MSGGVDSSVVAGLLVEQGHDVIGVHMKLHDAPAHPSVGAKRCCGVSDVLDCQLVADRLGIPFYVMDLREAFKKAVMDNFADTYLRGGTPNPCIQCNGVLKFQVLLQRAKALGASHLATGHYARITEDHALQMAADRNKDQTYFLFPVKKKALARTIFPLGELTKAEVRAEARRMGMVTASKPESQEICFIPDDDHTRFVREHRPGAEGAGDIVDQEGRVVGTHDGYWRFTIGQRRGLGVALGYPVYVLSVDAKTHRVVVGPNEALHQSYLRATGPNWYNKPSNGDQVQARIRHRGDLLTCTVVEADGKGLVLRFPTAARAAAPGQAVVLYHQGVVLGGAWITESWDAR
jgi:tRNA-specific 2-thiouridylase